LLNALLGVDILFNNALSPVLTSGLYFEKNVVIKSLNKLVDAKFADSHIENRGKNGRTRIITAKQPSTC